MNPSAMKLTIVLPERVAVSDDASSVVAEDSSGVFGVRPGHEPMMTVLVPSLLSYVNAGGATMWAAVDSGLMIVDGNTVEVFTRDAHVAANARDAHDAALERFGARALEDAARRNAFAKMQVAALRMLFGHER